MNAHQSTANPATSITGESGLTVQVPPRWGDMDAYGHVNNVAILSLLEEARIAVFGPPPSSGQKPQNLPAPPIPLFGTMPAGVQALIAEHGVRYLGQLPYTGEPLEVNVRVEKVSAASVRVGYSIYSPVDHAECVRAFTVLAFWDAPAARLSRLTPEQRELLTQYMP